MKLPNLKEEKSLWTRGLKYVCGVDEVGRGSWAGPVVAAAVIFPTFFKPVRSRIWSAPTGQDPGSKKLIIRDSKQLLPHQRERLDKFIRDNCLAYSIAETDVKTINREGIAKATQRAFRRCLKTIQPAPDFVLVDAFSIKYFAAKRQKAIIRGDQKSVSIAAASIVAKVYRDRLMRKLHQNDGRYRFDRHKGYGTRKHQAAIKKHGISSHHRLAFVPQSLYNS